MPNYGWPEFEKRKVIGKRISRLDGLDKSSGRAKYPSDMNPQGLLHATLVVCPHGHARVRSIDTSAAEKMPGVTAVYVISTPGTEIQWANTEVAAVAANTEPQARDAARAIKVDYEVLPHVVQEHDLSKVGSRAKPSGEQITGDPEAAFKTAEVTSEGSYGIPVITHCCLEPHGTVIQWQGDKVNFWPSTQGVSTVGAELGRALEVPAANVTVDMQYMGGGFGSKFPADRWHIAAAHLSKKSGGKPVMLFLDRATELTVAGVRPSHFANIKLGAKKDGTITVWQSESWSSGGFAGGGMAPLPYVLRNKMPNYRLNHTAVALNAGPQRAWRAPNHPQASFLTCSAVDDLAAKLGMDPYDVFFKNVEYTERPEVYRKQLAKAAELIEYRKLWQPRGKQTGVIRRNVGIGINSWNGAGHASKAKMNIHADGSVELEIGTQDLGVGTRTILSQVAAETLGLPMSMITIKIGNNAYPPSGPSGGSTTVGGVCSATRKASVNSLAKLFEAVAPSLNVPADQLEVLDSRVRVIGNPDKGMSWKQACQKLGTNTISEMGENDPKKPEGLNTAGAAGIQMADVSVDVETGRVRLNKLVAVQDCGLVVNPKTAESQVFGACIMSACAALMEERVMDPHSGRVLNADMEFYKLAGISDIGEIVVHMDIAPEHDKRGIVGLGEPPAIGGVAAIANAVANACGTRVPNVPLVPRNVLAALQGQGRNA